MNAYVVSYDLTGPGADYTDLYDRLEGFPTSVRVTESTWVVQSAMTAEEVFEALRATMDSKDRLFVARYRSGSGAHWVHPICGNDDLKDAIVNT